jgi:DNA invertase Pin-like site-specific DNA recombinase
LLPKSLLHLRHNTLFKTGVLEIMVKIGYVRISRDNQNPESQIKLMKDMGIVDNDIYVDRGMSGWIEPNVRPVYKDMMKRLSDTQKPKVDTIVFSEFSRLSRNSKESVYELIRLEKMGFAIQSLSASESIINNIDPTFQLVILAAIGIGADLERKHHKERTLWGLENVRERGSKSGKPMGRPKVNIDFDKVKKLQEQYNVSENVARKICGYSTTTFYTAKKQRIQKESGVVNLDKH